VLGGLAQAVVGILAWATGGGSMVLCLFSDTLLDEPYHLTEVVRKRPDAEVVRRDGLHLLQQSTA
jgi:hypothetical protein